jgi:CheY-like chemotaxis protein
MKIAIVDDDAVTRRLLLTTLEQLGHSCVAYEDGEVAWEALATEPADIVVSDWLMPKVDGLELCAKIREATERTYTYFILLTQKTDNRANHLAAMKAGIDDFLPKPLDFEQIWMRLRVAERILSFTFRISRLESLLPICAYCKKIRSDEDYWEAVEGYLTERTGIHFSHSICPDCVEEHVNPQMEALEERRAAEAQG